MSFDLRLHFTGLMTWVPEGNLMHVLLPSTGEHTHTEGGGEGPPEHEHDPAPGGPTPIKKEEEDEEKIEPHFARLVYDAAYGLPGQTQLVRSYKMVDLTGRVLQLTGLATTEGFTPHLTDELPALGDVAGPIPASRVVGLPTPPLGARVTMDAGALTDYELGAHFDYAGKEEPQRMTFGTEWTIRGIASRSMEHGGAAFLPRLKLLGPGEGQEELLPPLFPIGQTIHLTVFDTVATEFPPDGPFFNVAGEGRDLHFGAYLDLCADRRPGDQRPRATTGKKVHVEGAKVTLNGPQVPSGICVHAKAQLG